MKKKIFIWIAGIIGCLILFLIATPFIFKDKIEQVVLETINKKLKAEVDFEEVDLSLFKKFPKANVAIKNLSVINKAPFEGDTLFFAEKVNLKMSVMELFKGNDEAKNIEGIDVKNSKVNIIFNADGIGNHDVVIDDNEEEDSSDDDLILDLNRYSIENMDISFTDLSSNIKMKLSEFYHSGKGNLSDNILDLDTESKARISFEMDGTKFLNNVETSLTAVIAMDMEKKLFTFKENEGMINQLPLKFDGSLQMLDAAQEYHMTFETPTSSFKNFLGLVPAEYSGNIKDVKTEGDFRVSGKVDGKLTDTTIPKLEIIMASDKASFKYPDLPKSVENIFFDAKIINETGLIDDTYVLVNKMAFKIDQDVFNASADIKNITTNAFVNAKLNGVINLANLSKAYPVKLDKELTGILKADVTTQFDMNSVEKNIYKNIKNSGNIKLTDFNYETEEMAKPLQVKEAYLVFNPSHVELHKLDLITGTTDIVASGTLDNFYGFLFDKQKIKGNFNLTSNNFVVSDVLKSNEAVAVETQEGKESKAETTANPEPLKIPSFLDCVIQANAKTVVYDNLTLKNVTGKLNINDETAHLQNMKTDIFGGQIAFNGDVSTKEQIPIFNMALKMTNLDIFRSFSELDLLKSIAPITEVIKGNINMDIKLKGKLDAMELTPVLNSLSGDVLGQLLSAKLDVSNSTLLSTLTNEIDFIDLTKINLDNLKTFVEFKDGMVDVKPFKIKYQEVEVDVKGRHGFDQTMDYNLSLNVPPKYLGSEVSTLLSKISANELSNIKNIPVKIRLTGNFSKPKVTTDLKESVTNLTNQIIEAQKNNLINKGTDALKGFLGGNKDSDSEGSEGSEDSTDDSTDKLIDDIGEGIKSLFGKRKRE